jgi:hypothetical protein
MGAVEKTAGEHIDFVSAFHLRWRPGNLQSLSWKDFRFGRLPSGVGAGSALKIFL